MTSPVTSGTREQAMLLLIRCIIARAAQLEHDLQERPTATRRRH